MPLIFLFDEKTRKDYVAIQIYGCIFMFIMSVFFLILGFYWKKVMFVSVVFFISWMLSLHIAIVWWKRHARKISIENDGITLYTSGGKLYHKYLFSEYKSTKFIIAMLEPQRRIFDEEHYLKECLVLYRDMELYEGMEYRSYWNDKNILFIQNPEAIAEVEKYIS
ncbi:MAG: hypothetical protein IJY88_05970 [Clostridia bacterium]|nr:hypothetical protein [Clostridia bacterium]